MEGFTNKEINFDILKKRAFNMRWAMVDDGVIPLTAADHDFPCAPEVVEALQDYIKAKEYKNGYVLWPIRIALSGKAMTPCGATELMEVIGKEETLKRLDEAIAKLERN